MDGFKKLRTKLRKEVGKIKDDYDSNRSALEKELQEESSRYASVYAGLSSREIFQHAGATAAAAISRGNTPPVPRSGSPSPATTPGGRRRSHGDDPQRVMRRNSGYTQNYLNVPSPQGPSPGGYFPPSSQNYFEVKPKRQGSSAANSPSASIMTAEHGTRSTVFVLHPTKDGWDIRKENDDPALNPFSNSKFTLADLTEKAKTKLKPLLQKNAKVTVGFLFTKNGSNYSISVDPSI